MLKDLSRGKPDSVLPRTEIYIATVEDYKGAGFKRPDFLVKELSGLRQEAADEKLAAYAVLARALDLCFCAKDLSGLGKTEAGKPIFDGFGVSVSHSRGLAAAAVSNGAVGVDIEEIRPDRFNAGLADKIRCGEESAPCCADEFVLLWTKKEALFKLRGGSRFLPWKIDTSGVEFKTASARFNGKSFYVTAAADSVSDLSFFSLSPSLTLEQPLHSKLK